MKTLHLALLLLCVSLVLTLKPKNEAQAHLRGKIGLQQSHNIRKAVQHRQQQAGNQHKQKLWNHQGTATENPNMNQGHQTQPQMNQNHELFGHSTTTSTTSYHEHEKVQRHQTNKHDWGSKSTSQRHEMHSTASQRHEWGSTSTSQRMHNTGETQQKQYKKAQHQMWAQQSSSPTSWDEYSKDQQYEHEQTDQIKHGNQQDITQTHKSHRLQEHDESATSSYTSSSDFIYHGHTKKMIATRHHEEQLHDEYSHENYDDDNDNYDDENQGEDDQYTDGNNGAFTQWSGHGNSQGRYSYQEHRQNDRDEPNNGDRYYYVDENEVPTEEDTSSDTSSVSQPNLREYVDYNNPLNPDDPAVKRQTKVVTTEAPDTVGAAKGADFNTDDETSVSSSAKYFYDNKKSDPTTDQTYATTETADTTDTTYGTTDTTYGTTDTTYGSTYVIKPDTINPYTITQTTETTVIPYHQQSTTTATNQADGTQQHQTIKSENQQHDTYKYQADANTNQDDTDHHLDSSQVNNHQASTDTQSEYNDMNNNNNDDNNDEDNSDGNEYSNDKNMLNHGKTLPQKKHEHDNSIQHKEQHEQTTTLQQTHQTNQETTTTEGSQITRPNQHLQYGTGRSDDNDDDDMNQRDSNQQTTTSNTDSYGNINQHQEQHNPHTQTDTLIV